MAENRNVATAGVNALSKDLASKLALGIAESRSQTTIPGGKPLLRLTRDGWCYGQTDEGVQDGSSWALNPLTISHGYCAWTNHSDPKQKNTLVGEIMVPVFEPKPIKPEPIDGWPFNEQRAVEMKCMDGDDQGVEVTYKNSSVGGMRAFDGLLAALQKQLQTTSNYPCPVVQLGIDSYRHQKWGQVQVPVFEIVGWAAMDGSLMPANGGGPSPELTSAAAEADFKANADAAPARSPRKVKAPLVKGKAAPAEPAPTARRRPTRR